MFYILKLLFKWLGGENMPDLYAILIINGRREFSEVPDKLKDQTRKVLRDAGLDENGYPLAKTE